jgi:Flp pilus assembly protein TadG
MRAHCRFEIIKHPARKLPLLFGEQASQIAEFAISAPLLVVFIVGIFDFSGAFNLKQKLGSAAQAGALVAASQPTRDLTRPASVTSPPSVVAVETSVFNYLANDKVLPNAGVGTCKPSRATVSHPTSLVWQYTIKNCDGIAADHLVIKIDRGDVFTSGTDNVAASHVTITFPHNWLFNRVITLVASSSTFLPTTQITADAVSQNMS